MASYLVKKGILTGCLDHYCLTCAEQFKTEEETLAHVVEVQHKENWKAVGYFEKYKEHFIRKIKGIYFCEPCSLTFPTATKVELHIGEQSHLDNKNKIKPWLKRVGNDIIAFNQYLISDDAWNGCVEDTCVLCNVEFDDRTSHKIIRSHVLNLINSKVVFDDSENTVVRTIDDRAKQCLTCNVIIGHDPASHFLTDEHREAYKLYDSSIQKDETKMTTPTYKTANVTQNVKGDTKGDSHEVIGYSNGDLNKEAVKNPKKEVKQNTDEDNDKNSKKDTQKVDEKIKNDMLKQSVEKENAKALEKIYCKNLGVKNYMTDVDNEKWCFLCEIILNTSPKDHSNNVHHQMLLKLHTDRLAGKHIDEHEETSATMSQKGKSSPYVSVVSYAKEHGFRHNLADNSYYCLPCTRRLSSTLDTLQKHVASRIHKENIREPETADISTKATIKESLFSCIYSFEIVDMPDQGNFILINDKFWVSTYGFFLIAKRNEIIFCYGCHIDLTPMNVLHHLQTKNHREIMSKCLLITSLKNEFIREIKMDLYHCGHCNIAENDCDDILDHIQTAEHKYQKARSEQFLRQHIPKSRTTVKDVEGIMAQLKRLHYFF